MKLQNYTNTVTKRFLKYVTVDTQSDPNSTTFPSTEKQKKLANILVNELQEIGLTDAYVDEHGYVFSTLPSNTTKKVPTICFCAHIDTSPDCSGENVKPIIHNKYNGENILFPDDKTLILSPIQHPSLSKQVGNDIITASGKTLLGADNKAGIAEIIDAIYYLKNNPQIKHGDIRVLFTPDEEIGRGVEMLDMKKLNADFGYTIDGEELGHIENETFSADGVTVTIYGVSTHPGFAKNKMESAIKIASEIIAHLPKNSISPETTEKKEGFIHPTSISGTIEKAEINFIIRDFTSKGLSFLENELNKIIEKVISNYKNSTFDFIVTNQYRNMKEILDQNPEVANYAVEAIQRTGVTPVLSSIRGGTDGSRLSFMGLPCPNIFAGEHAFHSKLEWVSIQDMEKAVATIVNLAIIWEEKA